MYSPSQGRIAWASGVLIVVLVISPVALLGHKSFLAYSASTSVDSCLLDGITVNYKVLVVLAGFNPEITLLSTSSLDNDVYVMRVYDCIVYLNVTYFIIDPGAWFREALLHILAESYEELGKPNWVVEYENTTRTLLDVKWVRLTSFYKQLSALVNATLEIMGVEGNDTVVIIGDLDGVSRQYYDRLDYNYTAKRYLELDGVRGWAGPYPLAFYDLTVISKPRPESYMPFAGLGRSTSYVDEPPLWDFNDTSELVEYVGGLVRDHVKFHIANLGDLYFSPLNVLVNVTILDFGDDRVVREIVGNLSEVEIVKLVKTMTPWINASVTYHIVDAESYPLLYRVIVNSPVNNEGFIEIDFTAIAGLLSEIAGGVNRGVNIGNATYNFIILATPKPSLFKMGKGFKFTVISTGPWGASSYPGFGYRIYNGGLPRVIAHELGHSLGELHPFQFRGGKGYSIRWLMDWTSTIMAYDDNVLAGFMKTRGAYTPDYYTVFRQSLVYGVKLIHYLYNNKTLGQEEATLLLRALAGNPIETLKRILDSYYSRSKEPMETTTITRTTTRTITETRTVTLNNTTTVTTSTILTETLTTTKTTTSIVTIKETSYITKTGTVTLRETITVTKTIKEAHTSTITTTITNIVREGGINIYALSASTIIGFMLGIAAYITVKRR